MGEFNSKAMNVIIVDDHELFRLGFRELLQKIPGIKDIDQASDGQEVMNLLKKGSYDIIFMDVRMPHTNGIEATAKIRALYPSIKVIALSMMEDHFTITRMFRAGANGYLLKNINFSEVKNAIHDVIAGKKYYSRKVSEALITEIKNGKLTKKRRLYKEELSDREKEIVRLICMSFKSREISDILQVSEKTIESHRTNIYSKLEIDNMVDLVFYAIDNGLVDSPEKKL